MTHEVVLLEKARSGDRNSLEQLLGENYKILKGYLLKATMNLSLAEDITQETMVKAILHIKSFQPRAKFSSWLISITNNLYRDYLRKAKMAQPMGDDCGPVSGQSLEDTVMDKLDVQKVQQILLHLPYEKRAVVILKHYYGYKYEEIAEILKCPIGTVRSRLHNSIAFIMKQLENGSG